MRIFFFFERYLRRSTAPRQISGELVAWLFKCQLDLRHGMIWVLQIRFPCSITSSRMKDPLSWEPRNKTTHLQMMTIAFVCSRSLYRSVFTKNHQIDHRQGNCLTIHSLLKCTGCPRMNRPLAEVFFLQRVTLRFHFGLLKLFQNLLLRLHPINSNEARASYSGRQHFCHLRFQRRGLNVAPPVLAAAMVVLSYTTKTSTPANGRNGRKIAGGH